VLPREWRTGVLFWGYHDVVQPDGELCALAGVIESQIAGANTWRSWNRWVGNNTG